MRTIVVAPHPDDEVLGAGGTLLRRKAEGGTLAWLIVTGITTESGWTAEKVRSRHEEIRKIEELIGFDEVFHLNYAPAQLDRVPIGELVGSISKVFNTFQPEEVLLPHPGDVHTDHAVVFSAVSSCTKWFRYPSVKRVMTYETLSETDFGLRPEEGFLPNVFVDIEPYIDAKLRAIEIYASELGAFPFPRSHEAIRALATLRGAAAGYMAAEAFQLLRERS